MVAQQLLGELWAWTSAIVKVFGAGVGSGVGVGVGEGVGFCVGVTTDVEVGLVGVGVGVGFVLVALTIGAVLVATRAGVVAAVPVLFPGEAGIITVVVGEVGAGSIFITGRPM